MNQSFGTGVAFLFLGGIGLFNLVLGISYLRKRNRSTIVGWLRILLGLFLFTATFWFARQLSHGFFQ